MITQKCFLYYCTFVRGIHRSPVEGDGIHKINIVLTKGQLCKALIGGFLVVILLYCWTNSRVPVDLRRRYHCNITRHFVTVAIIIYNCNSSILNNTNIIVDSNEILYLEPSYIYKDYPLKRRVFDNGFIHFISIDKIKFHILWVIFIAIYVISWIVN